MYGSRIREMRKKRGLTLKAVAEATIEMRRRALDLPEDNLDKS